MRRVAHACLYVLCGLGSCFPIGCSGDAPHTAPVSGKVAIDGQPLREGFITFLPDVGRAASGKIVDGKIVEVTCLATNDGVPLGGQKVGISSLSDSSGDMYAVTKSLIPESYANPMTSGLTADIVADGPNELKFDLSSKKR